MEIAMAAFQNNDSISSILTNMTIIKIERRIKVGRKT
jgi:hypothetical protein